MEESAVEASRLRGESDSLWRGSTGRAVRFGESVDAGVGVYPENIGESPEQSL